MTYCVFQKFILLIGQNNSLFLRTMLGTFAVLRKVTFGFIISVRLSVRPTALGCSVPTSRKLVKFCIDYFP